MSPIDVLLILLLIGGASYTQTVTGFAFGLILLGGVTLLGLAPIAVTAYVVSLLSLFNSALALRGHRRDIQRPWVLWMLLPCAPMVAAGVWLLGRLSQTHTGGLQMLLGLLLVGCSALMMFEPRPRGLPSPPLAFSLAGALSGLMGGMFATFGPPAAYLLYRQPGPLVAIRASLQALFIVTAVLRIAMASGGQPLDTRIYWISALGAPIVLLGTLAGRRFRPPLPDAWMRRIAFALLLLTGAGLTAGALR